jgi:hypothetical protein
MQQKIRYIVFLVICYSFFFTSTEMTVLAETISEHSIEKGTLNENISNYRKRPGKQSEQKRKLPDINPLSVPAPSRYLPRETVPVPDRWRLIESIGINERWWDPYNQNTLKADRPLFDDWFVNLAVISDTVFELREIPIPVGPQGGSRAGSIDLFGKGDQRVFSQSLITSVSFIKGDTAFRPPDWEIRLTPVLNYNNVKGKENRALLINPENGKTRKDGHFALQEAFVDYHIRNVSDRYDFDSIRVGIQPLILDFRGFLFQDQQLAIRFFGNRKNNIWQYNLGWFRRIEKDTNSGLNDTFGNLREDDTFFANLYRQDWPVLGYTVQGLIAHNRNREGKNPLFFNKNGFLERPASLGVERGYNYNVTYLGFNGDGHFGRLNLTHAAYLALGNISANPLTSFFEDEPAKIQSWFLALEPSIDFDWIRLRAQFLYASGDKDPFDNKAQGFDAIFENPQFAGADTSYWMRQPVPFIGGGGVFLNGRNGLLNSLRTSKEQGQSNFLNPGTFLYGVGIDLDLFPELRVFANINKIGFANKSMIEVLRNQPLSSKSIGWDSSVSLLYRPTFIQNVVFRASGAMLSGGNGFKELFSTERKGDKFYSVLFNLILSY